MSDETGCDQRRRSTWARRPRCDTRKMWREERSASSSIRRPLSGIGPRHGGKACFIDVRTLCFVSPHQAFCNHDLQEFEDAGVAGILFFAQGFVDFAHSGGSAGPQYAEDFQLRNSGFLQGLLHGKETTTK